MRLLPSSPRRRRRLGWSVAGLLALGIAGTIVVVAPRGTSLPPDRLVATSTVAAEREVKLTPAMRRGITATLRQFLPAAVARRDEALAWQLAGPGLRAGTTRRDWLAGRSPVFPFPVEKANLDDWRPVYTYRNRVGFDLLLHPPAKTRRGPIAVSVDVVRSGRRWLVDTWYVSAVFTGPDDRPFVTGSPDFQASAGNKKEYERPKFADAELSPLWFAVPGAIIGLVLVVPLVLVLVSRRRNRRAEAAYRATARR
jgi:hypothetical protein